MRLQNALSASPDQVSSLPPPLIRIRELEQENIQLNREVEHLRRQLEARNARLRPDIDHRHHTLSPYDDRPFDREAKRRRGMQLPDDPYMVSDEHLAYFLPVALTAQSQLTNNQLPSPPLSTSSALNPYPQSNSASSMTQPRSPTTPMAASYGLAYPMPETPSSSTASSPSTTSFSASVLSALPFCAYAPNKNFGS